MAFDNETLLKARAAAKAESDAIRARNTVKDTAEFEAAKKPKPRAKRASVASPVMAAPRPAAPAPAPVPWMREHVIDPAWSKVPISSSPSNAQDPGEMLAAVIHERMMERVPDDLLIHKLDKKGDLPKTSDHALERHIDHSYASAINDPPGLEAMRVLRALLPNRKKRTLVTNYISKLMKLTRDACISKDALAEEINEHLDWVELQFSVEEHHVEPNTDLEAVDVSTMVRLFEKLCHDDRQEFLTKSEKVRPLHPAFM